MKSGVIITIAIVVLLAVVGGYFLLSQSDTIEETSSFCTADVFECPDGSFVQRNPDNNCEFNTCPAINNQTNDSEPIDALAYIIEIKNFAFAPSTLEINVGDMVTWDNKDSATHSIKSDSGSELTSPTFSKGGSYSHVFTTPGEYAYHCGVHFGMKGTIIVR